MKTARSSKILAALAFSALAWLFFSWLTPRLASQLVTSCRSFLFSCENSLLSFMASSFFFPYLPLALLFFALTSSSFRLLLAFFYLARLEKVDKLPEKLKKIIQKTPELEGYRLKLVNSAEPFALARGFTKPSIYLSTSLLSALSQKELKGVLLHELAHLEKKHHLKLLLASFFRDALFFLPLAHQLYRSFALHQELEADSRAASKITNPLVLAQALIKTAFASRSLVGSFPQYQSEPALVSRIKMLTGQRLSERKAQLIKSFFVSLLVVIVFLAALGFAFPSATDCPDSCPSFSKCCSNKN